MTDKELENKAEESYWISIASGGMSSKKCYTLGFIDGVKVVQEEVERLKQLLDAAKITLDVFERTEDDTFEKAYLLGTLKELLGDTNDKK